MSWEGTKWSFRIDGYHDDDDWETHFIRERQSEEDVDAEGVAIDAAEYHHADRDGVDATVLVRDPDGEVTRWEVTSEMEPTFTATELEVVK